MAETKLMTEDKMPEVDPTRVESLLFRFALHFLFWTIIFTLLSGAVIFQDGMRLWAHSRSPSMALLGWSLIIGVSIGTILTIATYNNRRR